MTSRHSASSSRTPRTAQNGPWNSPIFSWEIFLQCLLLKGVLILELYFLYKTYFLKAHFLEKIFLQYLLLESFLFKVYSVLERSFEITLEMVRTNTSNCLPRFKVIGVGVHRGALTEGGYRGSPPHRGGILQHTLKPLLLILHKDITIFANCKEKSVFLSIKIASFFQFNNRCDGVYSSTAY